MQLAFPDALQELHTVVDCLQPGKADDDKKDDEQKEEKPTDGKVDP